MTSKQRDQDQAQLWEEASKDAFYASDALKDRLDLNSPKEWDVRPKENVLCTLYYESPSEGVKGRFIQVKRSNGEFLVGMELDNENLGECISCPEFIRMVVTIDDNIVYEIDFVEPWEEISRNVIAREGKIELYVSLKESNT